MAAGLGAGVSGLGKKGVMAVGPGLGFSSSAMALVGERRGGESEARALASRSSMPGERRSLALMISARDCPMSGRGTPSRVTLAGKMTSLGLAAGAGDWARSWLWPQRARARIRRGVMHLFMTPWLTGGGVD